MYGPDYRGSLDYREGVMVTEMGSWLQRWGLDYRDGVTVTGSIRMYGTDYKEGVMIT